MCFSMSGQACRRMCVLISSGPGAVLPALNIAVLTSSCDRGGKEIAVVAAVGASRGTSPTSARLTRRELVKILLFSEAVVAGGLCGFVGSWRGDDR